MWTSRAPASRTMRTILREVVPRTIESSISTTRRPSITWRTGLSLIFTPAERSPCRGWMKVRPDVVVADQAPLERDARSPASSRAPRRPRCRARPRPRRPSMPRLARELPAEHDARLQHRAAEHQAVGTREVDVLEHAVRRRLRRERLERAQPLGVDDHDLARLDVAHVLWRRSGRGRRSPRRTRSRRSVARSPAGGSPTGRARRPSRPASGTAARRRPSPCTGWRRSRPRAARGGCARRGAGSPRCPRSTGRSTRRPRAPWRRMVAFTRLPLWTTAIGPRWHSIRYGCAFVPTVSPAVE